MTIATRPSSELLSAAAVAGKKAADECFARTHDSYCAGACGDAARRAYIAARR
jgi:hypothetical protein